MFIGHFGLGFAARPLAPRLSLAVLFAAAQLADVLWPVFVAPGLEQVRIDPGHTAVTPLDFVLGALIGAAILLAWAAWMDRHRDHTRPSSADGGHAAGGE